MIGKKEVKENSKGLANRVSVLIFYCQELEFDLSFNVYKIELPFASP